MMSANGGLAHKREERIDPLGILGGGTKGAIAAVFSCIAEKIIGLKLWLVAWGIE